MTRKQLFLLLAVALFALAFRFTFVPVLISGASMEPTLHSGALRLMIRRHSAALPPRFQIVLVRAGGELLVKRVIAFPGEWVSMTNGLVFINGTALAEPFQLKRGSWTVRAGPISPGKVLLIGDNRELPFQSFFVVPRDAIVAWLHACVIRNEGHTFLTVNRAASVSERSLFCAASNSVAFLKPFQKSSRLQNGNAERFL